MKKIGILGSTGSIGTQTLQIVRDNKDLDVRALAAGSNVDMLEEQIREFHPEIACLWDADKAAKLKERVKDLPVKIVSGMEGMLEIAVLPEMEILVTAVVGMIGIKPTIAAIEAGKDIALANKETLVTAGHLIMPLAKKMGVSILPVDSEHSAIFQCLSGSFNDRKYLSHLVLTASGGPFFGKDRSFLKTVTPQMALNHPVWSMGQKISIDSATLLNKGLELIEAVRLFDVSPSQVKITVHRQSIVHSMVTFADGATLAQMGHPDMRHCIQFALTYPHRTPGLCEALDFSKTLHLTFEKADEETFSLLRVAREAAEKGGTYTTVLNAANESAVRLFLAGKISFLGIFDIVENEVLRHVPLTDPDIDQILLLDQEIKAKVLEKYSNGSSFSEQK